MPFVKGQSGNPSGRPQDSAEVKLVKKMARDNSIKALQRLIDFLDDESPTIAMRAADSILDRALGKPSQAIIGDEDNPIQHEHNVTKILLQALKK